MTNEQLSAALHEKMLAEQKEFREWMMNLPPRRIMSLAYEYIVREDILMCVKDAALSDKQLQALLKLERPVTEIYEAFRMRETNQIDIVIDTIKCHANAMIRADFLRDRQGER